MSASYKKVEVTWIPAEMTAEPAAAAASPRADSEGLEAAAGATAMPNAGEGERGSSRHRLHRVDTSRIAFARGFWLRLVVVTALPTAAALAWLALPQHTLLLYFGLRLGFLGIAVGLVVAGFLTHAIPIRQIGKIPRSSQVGLVLGYGVLVPAATPIGVYMWGSLSPDAAYLAVIVAHIVLMVFAVRVLPRTFINHRDAAKGGARVAPTACPQAQARPSPDVPPEAEAKHLPYFAMGHVRGARISNAGGVAKQPALFQIGEAKDAVLFAQNAEVVVRSLTVRVGWALIILACQLRFCIMFAVAEVPDSRVAFVFHLAAYRLAVLVFKFAERVALGRHSGLFPPLEYASLIFSGFPYRIVVVSVDSWDMFATMIALETVYKLLIYPLHLTDTVQGWKGKLINKWLEWLQMAMDNAVQLQNAAITATPRRLRKMLTKVSTESDEAEPEAIAAADLDDSSSVGGMQAAEEAAGQTSVVVRMAVGHVQRSISDHDLEETGPDAPGYYIDATATHQNGVARVLLEEQGFKFDSTYDRKRLSTKFFFHSIVDIISIANVGLLFVFMRQEGGTLISLLSDNEWETLYMRYLMGVVFEIFLTITVSAISTELLSDRLGFFPIAFGSAELVRGVALMTFAGLVVNLTAFTTLDFARAPEWIM